MLDLGLQCDGLGWGTLPIQNRGTETALGFDRFEVSVKHPSSSAGATFAGPCVLEKKTQRSGDSPAVGRLFWRPEPSEVPLTVSTCEYCGKQV